MGFSCSLTVADCCLLWFFYSSLSSAVPLLTTVVILIIDIAENLSIFFARGENDGVSQNANQYGPEKNRG